MPTMTTVYYSIICLKPIANCFSVPLTISKAIGSVLGLESQIIHVNIADKPVASCLAQDNHLCTRTPTVQSRSRINRQTPECECACRQRDPVSYNTPVLILPRLVFRGYHVAIFISPAISRPSVPYWCPTSAFGNEFSI